MDSRRELVGRAEAGDESERVVLDMDSTESPVHGQQEGSAYNGANYLPAPAIQSGLFNTSRGRLPSGGLMMPSRSMASRMRAARPYPSRIDCTNIRSVFKGDSTTVKRGRIPLSPKSIVDRDIGEGLQDFKKSRSIGPLNIADAAAGATTFAAPS